MRFQTLKTTLKTELAHLYPPTETDAMAQILISHATGFSSQQLLYKNTQTLDSEQQSLIQSFLPRLIAGVPLQYVLGETTFFDLQILVDSSVLIPRPETEELVALILKNNRSPAPKNVLDLCTGSGCIALALKKNLPNAQVFAIDVCENALKIAKKNADRLGLDVQFSQADLLHDALPQLPNFDVMVSNPPYVLHSERAQMHVNVLNFEPHLALFVPDDDALIFYEKIAQIALEKLNPNGKLFFEINPLKATNTIELLQKMGFKNIEPTNDLNQKIRFVTAEKP